MVIGFKGKNKRGSDVFSNDPYHNSWGGGGGAFEPYIYDHE